MFVMCSITTSDKPFDAKNFKDAIGTEVFSTNGNNFLGLIKSVVFSDDMLEANFIVE